MLCLRCGRCCIHLGIFIVNPASISGGGSINPEQSLAASMIFKPGGEMCPHLKFPPRIARESDGPARKDQAVAISSGGAAKNAPSAENPQPEGSQAVCSIHHLPCYRDTPCDRFEQIGPEDAVCIMSGYYRSIDEQQPRK